jgi:hypothetical protein
MDKFLLYSGLLAIVLGILYNIALFYAIRKMPEFEIKKSYKIIAVLWFVLGIPCILLGFILTPPC